MIGYVCYRQHSGEKTERMLLGGVAVLRVYVPPGGGLPAFAAARAAARLFRRSRIRLAAFPPDYRYQRVFARCGVRAGDVAALRRLCAAEIVRCALLERGVALQDARVALCARKASPELHRAAAALARSVRYLSVCAPDAERIARTLRWECGIAVRAAPPEEPPWADLTVLFDGDGTEGTLPLASPELALTLHAQGEGWESGDAALLAALCIAGGLKAEEVRVEWVIFPARGNYP